MSKIVYILGAGASYGERYKNHDGTEKIGAIKRGVPLVSEIQESIGYLLSADKLGTSKSENNSDYKATDDQIAELKELLFWLKAICETYPTIDTYAKLLHVTSNTTEYSKLKKALALYYTLVQNPMKRDLRYDGFLASLINEKIEFPNDITILSWNYDYQIEFAFSNYVHDSLRSINHIWKNLNLYDKPQGNLYSKDSFSVIKLNGTASFIGEAYAIVDMYFGTKTQSILSKLGNLLVDQNEFAKTDLSFAWEEDNHFLNNVKEKVEDAEVVVVIGYSFPYFNRDFDRGIIRSMSGLKKVYIQDPKAEEIKESFEATLSEEQLSRQSNGDITYVHRKNLSQFVIPNELI